MRQKRRLEDLESVGRVSNCTGCAVGFSRVWVPRRPKLRFRFCNAIRIATKQKSVSLAKRAEATYAEYRRQKASGSEGRGFRIPTVVTAYSAVPMGRGFQSQYLRILSRNVIRRASSIREHAIARATGPQYARRCAGRFRTARCERDVAAGRGCG